MSWKRPRVTPVRLIVAAALLGSLLAAEKMRRVGRYRGERAAELVAEAKSWSRAAATVERMMADPGGVDEADARVRLAEIRAADAAFRAIAEYCRRLASTYERAARRPWLRMDPDPPPPW